MRNIWQASPAWDDAALVPSCRPSRAAPSGEGLTHFQLLAQRKHHLKDTLGGFNDSMTQTAQVELNSG